MVLPRGPVPAVAGLALASAVAALVLSSTLFPHLSTNNDEGIYRLHAETLAHGDLFPAVPARLAEPFRPWLAAVDGGHYVLKYNPAVPGLIAVSLALTGGPGLFLALVAAAATLMTFVLAREVLGDGLDAVVAAALVALSPLVVVQSGLLLPYLTTLVLLEAFCWGLVRSTPRSVLVAGLALGAAFVVRPYDAVLFGAPLLLWFLLARPGRRALVAFVVPAALVASTFFAYNAVATGRPLQPSFSLLEPQDTLGFGTRRLYPTDPPHEFGLEQGVQGAVRHVRALNTWLIGGVVVFALAAVTVLRRRAGTVGPWLAATAVALPLGYVFFWGPWNAAVLWGGTRYVGPFYFLPVLIPAAVLGARGLGDLFRTRVWAGALAVVAIVALSTPTLVRVIDDNAGFDRQSDALATLTAHGAGPKLVLADLPTPFLMHPSPVVGNRWDASGATLYAVSAPATDLAVVDAFPGRTCYRLTFDDDFREPRASLSGRLEQLHLTTADRVELDVTARAPATSGPLAIAVTADGVRRTYPLGDGPAPGHVYHERLEVTANSATLLGHAPAREVPDAGAGVGVQLLQGDDPASAPVTVGTQTLASRADGSTVTLLAPGAPSWTVGPRPPALSVTL